jgi:hypothetical protein
MLNKFKNDGVVMEVKLTGARVEGGCWNIEPIGKYTAEVGAREARVADNPDLTILPGRIICSGCVVNEGGNGIFCTAQLTETQVSLVGTRSPLPEDVYVPMSSVPGYKMVKPGSGKMAEGYIVPKETPAPQPINETPQLPKGGLDAFLIGKTSPSGNHCT